MKSISPQDFKTLCEHKNSKQIIIDVRTPEEFAIEHIAGAKNMPVDYFEDYKDELKQYEKVAAYCNTGSSSTMFCKRAAHEGIEHVYNVTGGLSTVKGLCPTIKKKSVLPMMQQVQVTAGLMIIAGFVLSFLFHTPRFLGLSLFVGLGLTYAGTTGRCGMAKILTHMPRNSLGQAKYTTTINGKGLHIKQFEDKNLAHYSYMAISDGEAIVVDPERNPQKYYDYAKEHNATIVGVLNTHPHADFASGHLQIHQETDAKIYVGAKVGAEYPHIAVKDQQTINFGSASIIAYDTPGHSPDSISYLVLDASQKQKALFTGDWLFIGDVGRADLRESVGNIKAKQQELAAMMYETTRNILPTLDASLTILPAHGAGTSCGKGLSKQNMDSLANQLKYNPMLQDMSKEKFISELTSDQPAIPAYFTHSVELNKHGNQSYHKAMQSVVIVQELKDDQLVVDTRTIEESYTYPLATNVITIPHGNKNFVSMLGALVSPDQKIVLIVAKHSDLSQILHAVLSIGYEKQLIGVYIAQHSYEAQALNQHDMKTHADQYVVLDLRSESAFHDNPMFENAVNIPMEQLMTKMTSLDKSKTYVPYCGGTYKSGIAFTALSNHGFTVKHMAV